MSKDTIEELKNNPIFNMSLSSKELFHSNFWAWLFEHNKKYIKIFFGDLEEIENNDIGFIEREQNHRDITIWTKDQKKAYVIENKFKSIPNKKQLQDYENKLNGNSKKFAKGIVTGIEEPDFIKDEDIKNNWGFKSYEEISGEIKNKAKKEEKESFEKDLIVNYAEMLGKLTDHIKKQHETTKGKWVPEYEDKYNLKIGDLILKLKASELAEEIKKEDFYENIEIKNDNFEKKVESAYYHKKPNVDIKFIIKDQGKEDSSGVDNQQKKGDLEEIGIQIEGNQFRRFIKMREKLEDKEKIKVFNEYVSAKWFDKEFNAAEKEKKIFGKKTSMNPKNKKFNQYVTDKYTFLYQYWDIDEYWGIDKKKNEKIEFEKLFEMIEADFELANEILSSYKKD